MTSSNASHSDHPGMFTIPEYSANTPGAVVNDLDNASPTAVACIKSQGDSMVALEIQVLQPTSSFNERSSSGGDSDRMGTFADLRKSLANSAIEIIGDRPPDRFVYSIFATIVCFPIGACALRHSLHCRKATRIGRLLQARDHSRLAVQLANVAVSMALLAYVLIVTSHTHVLFNVLMHVQEKNATILATANTTKYHLP
ncbi:hypothetical protein LSAT2_001508 [Lamellibrachia satsuma]|nr:hypothetical protein LSAT2_001508 [Lamellibrachia satsuma]